MLADEAGRRRGWALVAGLLVLACLLALPAAARAGEQTYVVDSTADEAAATPGSETCQTAAGKCTLRAAIEESNASVGEADKIEFDEAVFTGQPASTIVLGASLPIISDRVLIEGHICTTAAGLEGPCVAVDGPPGAAALSVSGPEAFETVIEGLAVTGAQVGMKVQGAPEFFAARDWFGVALDGSAAPNQTGLLLGQGSGRSKIGSPGAGLGNVFANSTQVGLEIVGSSHVRVRGNYFGVGPDGATPAPNGTGIRVVSTPTAPAAANSIGARLDPVAAGTPRCDGDCNVIAGSLSTGLEITGRAVEEGEPVEPTLVLGNDVGLDAAGSAAMPNLGAGVAIEEAQNVTVGGLGEAGANRIAGGAAAVLGVAAPSLVVRGNRIGFAAGVSAPSAAPGVGIDLEGSGALVSHNQIAGAETGVAVAGPSEGDNLIDGNAIEASRDDGVLLESSLNTVVGNLISSSGGAGVRVLGSPPFGVTGNVVGGDSAGEENVISGSGSDAVEIADPEATLNEIARNRGAGNRGLFIDLVALSSGKPPNRAIPPPGFASVTPSGASGSGEATAVVRVFRKASAEAGEIESFLGQAVVDASGHWQVGFAALPPGTAVAATQTSLGGTSELATAQTPAAPPRPAAAAGRKEPPLTLLLHGPRRRWHHRWARFRFASNEPGADFECRLDARRFRDCRSPRAYGHLEPGEHTFQVRAVDGAGEVDPTPARREFRVLRRR